MGLHGSIKETWRKVSFVEVRGKKGEVRGMAASKEPRVAACRQTAAIFFSTCV
jgi:hypothetical protein